MRLEWSEEALHDYREIARYLVSEAPAHAVDVLDRIDAAAIGLKNFPDRFRPGVRPETREHVIYGLPYIIVYLVHSDWVEILSLVHTSRDIPRGG